ncbi:hypothetical protein WMY93_016369 [Mugilogobius chulae]|uniref:Centrosomal protein 57kDa-like protein 1 n=1 Tax=Mugilogobius chulae TaxID=88201 RepID=A0AAW0NTX4_9GOBI
MEAYSEQGLESPSRNSYIGSYYQPPDEIMPLPRRLDFHFHSVVDSVSPTNSHLGSQSKSNFDSQALADALKTLQEKISRTKAETSRHIEKSRQVSHEAQNQQDISLTTLPITQTQQKNENLIKCRILQKHLEETKRSIEKTKKEQSTLHEKQNSLQNEQFNTNIQLQKEKLEKLETEYEKLSRTQTLAEMKLTMLEEKLKREEHERKLVQEKAEELQREFDSTLRMSTEDRQIKKKTKKTKNKEKQNEKKSPIRTFSQKMPFVAGKSTSPSHSVHANVQSVLHMMKHHQPELHERVSLLHKSVAGARKSLRKDFSTSSSVLQRHNSEGSESEESLGSLSDLLLALQDELGQMSFEHRELMHQIDSTHDHKRRQDLKNELERLVTKMEEKGSQITKLRKHQQMIHKMTENQQQNWESRKTTRVHPLGPSPVKPKKKLKKLPATPSNLQLLRQTQQFRNTLKQGDVFWET